MMDSKDAVKRQLAETLASIERSKRMLLGCDSHAVYENLDIAAKSIRPILFFLRTGEENQKQQEVDRYT